MITHDEKLGGWEIQTQKDAEQLTLEHPDQPEAFDKAIEFYIGANDISRAYRCFKASVMRFGGRPLNDYIKFARIAKEMNDKLEAMRFLLLAEGYCPQAQNINDIINDFDDDDSDSNDDIVKHFQKKHGLKIEVAQRDQDITHKRILAHGHIGFINDANEVWNVRGEIEVLKIIDITAGNNKVDLPNSAYISRKGLSELKGKYDALAIFGQSTSDCIQRLEKLTGDIDPKKKIYLLGTSFLRNSLYAYAHEYRQLQQAVKRYLCEKGVYIIHDAISCYDILLSALSQNDHKKMQYDGAEFYRQARQGNLQSFFNERLSDFPYTSHEYITSVFCDKYFNAIETEFGIKATDINTPFFNVHNGLRKTMGQPENFTNQIFFVGGCSVAFGFGIEDKNTVPSKVQQKLNQIQGYDSKYRCVNCAAPGQTVMSTMEQIYTLPLRSGDVIVVSANTIDVPRLLAQDFYDNIRLLHKVRDDMNANHCYYFLDGHITTPYATSHYADYVVNALKSIEHASPLYERNSVYSKEQLDDMAKLEEIIYAKHEKFFEQQSHTSGLKEFLEELHKVKLPKGTTGAIVMNCNPFSLGHKYLIEYASGKVDNLVVFVVEEDKSFFKFADRIELVRQGSAEFGNVTVIPSGNFIISSKTMPGYFDKDALQEVQLDASLDLEIFARHISRALNITVRFAGEEPTDKFTRQYNQQMREILPNYGIRFVEIPRKEFGGRAISASLVRKILKTDDRSDLLNLVPKTTYDFLMKNF